MNTVLAFGLVLGVLASAQAADKKPNILVLRGDDIGTWNISHNNLGMVGYQTPNIDRLATEGVAFTDYYGQQSCTAGRAAFISGSVLACSGMAKVGLPGAPTGWQKTDCTMATVLKAQGYTPLASSARTTRATAMSICRAWGENHDGFIGGYC
jgi:arylsulfatase A-like enzyme